MPAEQLNLGDCGGLLDMPEVNTSRSRWYRMMAHPATLPAPIDPFARMLDGCYPTDPAQYVAKAGPA